MERRLNVSPVGFQPHPDVAETSEADTEVLPEDLMTFGLIPELIGRLPVVVQLHDLSLEALVAVLTEPRNALVRQYQALFGLDGVTLTFTVNALEEVARRAKARKTGARALRSVLERSLLPLMFEVPGSGITQLHIDVDDLDDPTRLLSPDQARKSA